MLQQSYSDTPPNRDMAALLRENETLKRQNAWLRNEREWTKKLFSNPNLEPADKLALQLHRWKSQERRVQPGEPLKMYYEEDAQRVGMTPETLGSRFLKLDKRGFVERDTSHTPKAVNKHVAVSVSAEVYQHIDTVQGSEPRNHGGKRVQCPSCGSEDIRVTRFKECTCCGTVFDKEQKMLHQPEDLPIDEDVNSYWDDKETSDE